MSISRIVIKCTVQSIGKWQKIHKKFTPSIIKHVVFYFILHLQFKIILLMKFNVKKFTEGRQDAQKTRSTFHQMEKSQLLTEYHTVEPKPPVQLPVVIARSCWRFHMDVPDCFQLTCLPVNKCICKLQDVAVKTYNFLLLLFNFILWHIIFLLQTSHKISQSIKS